MSGANASPARSASAVARSLKKLRSHQEMSGANASPAGRSHQEIAQLMASLEIQRQRQIQCRFQSVPFDSLKRSTTIEFSSRR